MDVKLSKNSRIVVSLLNLTQNNFTMKVSLLLYLFFCDFKKAFQRRKLKDLNC
jgi:hypothetical protein